MERKYLRAGEFGALHELAPTYDHLRTALARGEERGPGNRSGQLTG